jgi:polyphosphate kinase
MKRNLEARVEILCPVELPQLIKELRIVLDTQLGDNRSAWDMMPDGSYVQRTSGDKDASNGSQNLMIARSDKRLKDSLKMKSKKHKHKARAVECC